MITQSEQDSRVKPHHFDSKYSMESKRFFRINR